MKEIFLSQVGLGSSSMHHDILYLKLKHTIANDAMMKNVEAYLPSFTSSPLINLPSPVIFASYSHLFSPLYCPYLRSHT